MRIKELMDRLQEAYGRYGDIPVEMEYSYSEGLGDEVKDVIVSRNYVTLYNWR